MINKSTKKAALKKLVKKDGKSPTKLDNGLGKASTSGPAIMSGQGSNLGVRGVF